MVGIKDRATKQVAARVVDHTDKPTLQGFVDDHADPDAKMYTDDATPYRGASRPHETVNHSAQEYVRYLEDELQPRSWEYWNPTDGFDAFDKDGRWIGHVSTPETWDARPCPGRNDPYFKGDTIWAVVKEEFDVRYIVRFQVDWPVPH